MDLPVWPIYHAQTQSCHWDSPNKLRMWETDHCAYQKAIDRGAGFWACPSRQFFVQSKIYSVTLLILFCFSNATTTASAKWHFYIFPDTIQKLIFTLSLSWMPLLWTLNLYTGRKTKYKRVSSNGEFWFSFSFFCQWKITQNIYIYQSKGRAPIIAIRKFLCSATPLVQFLRDNRCWVMRGIGRKWAWADSLDFRRAYDCGYDSDHLVGSALTIPSLAKIYSACEKSLIWAGDQRVSKLHEHSLTSRFFRDSERQSWIWFKTTWSYMLTFMCQFPCVLPFIKNFQVCMHNFVIYLLYYWPFPPLFSSDILAYCGFLKFE